MLLTMLILLIITGPPQCSTNASSQGYTVTEQQQVSVECIVCFTGHSPINTRCAGINLVDSGNNRESVTRNSTCEVYLKTYVFDRTMHRSVLLCTVTIGSNYSNTWTSPPFIVNHGPTSVSISPKTAAVFQHDDKLTCLSDGHPEPDYSWVSGNVTQRGPQFTVDICELSKAHTFSSRGRNSSEVATELTCIAKRGTKSVSATVIIMVAVDDHDTLCDDGIGDRDHATNVSNVLFYSVISGVVGTILCVIVLFMVTIVCFRTYVAGLARRDMPAEDLLESHEMSPNVDVPEHVYEGSQLGGGYEDMAYTTQQIQGRVEEMLNIQQPRPYQLLQSGVCDPPTTAPLS